MCGEVGREGGRGSFLTIHGEKEHEKEKRGSQGKE